MGLRILYRELAQPDRVDDVRLAVTRYEAAWHRYTSHGAQMRYIVELLRCSDVPKAALEWNRIDQRAVDAAYSTLLGEREPVHARGPNLNTIVWKYFGLAKATAVDKIQLDRKLRVSDHDDVWVRTLNGACNGCGAPTISHSQRESLKRAFERYPTRFDLTVTYRQRDGKQAPLWPRVTNAAKGVAEHVQPWSQGGRTNPSNLTNACAGCNYARMDTSMDQTGAAAYAEPRPGANRLG